MQLPLFNQNETHHSPKNVREAVLYYLSKLDIEMLELVLDDKRTYQEATKEVFVDKLKKAVSVFIQNGDSELKVVKGECQSDKCNKGCLGYAFIGNCSNYHLDLIVEGASNEILDVYYCSDFNAYSEKLDINKKISIYINRDEQADFKPSVFYLITSQKCVIACDGIIRNDLHLPIVNMQHAEQWLEKYKDLFDSMNPVFPPAAFAKFQSLYRSIGDLVPMYNMKKKAKSGLRFYYNRVKRSRNERILLYWLVEYEILMDDLFSLQYFYFGMENETTEEYVSINGVDEVYLSADDFKDQLKFLEIYTGYYWDMLNKYTTVPEEQWGTLIAGTEASDKRTSLTYHLKQRGMI